MYQSAHEHVTISHRMAGDWPDDAAVPRQCAIRVCVSAGMSMRIELLTFRPQELPQNTVSRGVVRFERVVLVV